MPKPSVNRFFASLAEEIGESTIGIILSGTGSDGAAGIHAIKAAGGFTFSQDPETAKYNGMPQSAIDTGSVDWILPPENMGAEISLIVLNRGLIPVATQAASAPATLKTLLGKVRSRTKVDFSQYKEPTLWRRIERRMAANHVSTLHDYLQVVDQTPVELDKLCKDILISVTAFFRDTDAFARLDKVVADILGNKQPGDDIRVWVAGCATGEEAYSLAILFSERLGAAFDQYRLQIFATDIDLDAMALAPARRLCRLQPGAHGPRSHPRQLHATRRPLRDQQEPARRGHLCPPGSGAGSAIPATRPGQLPQRADLFPERAAGAAAVGLPLRAQSPALTSSSANRKASSSRKRCSASSTRTGASTAGTASVPAYRCCAARCSCRPPVSTSISGRQADPPRWVSRTSCSKRPGVISFRPAS
jgi:hypothetical protein